MIKKNLKFTFIFLTVTLLFFSNFIFVQAVEQEQNFDSNLNKIYSNATVMKNLKMIVF